MVFCSSFSLFINLVVTGMSSAYPCACRIGVCEITHSHSHLPRHPKKNTLDQLETILKTNYGFSHLW